MTENNASANQPDDELEHPSSQAEVRIWTTPVSLGPQEEPTTGASVRISASREGVQGKMGVPAENASQMIKAAVLVAGFGASAAGPIFLLKACRGQMPGSFEFILALILAISPIAHMIFGHRRGEN